MQFELGAKTAAPGTTLTVKAVKFEEDSVLLEDKNGAIYRSYYDQQPLWQTTGKPYLGTVGCTLWGAVGESSTPGAHLRFFVRKFIALPQSELTRSPRDVFKAPVNIPAGTPTVSQILAATDPIQEELETTVDSIKHRPRPEPLAGDTSSINIRLEGELAAWVRQQSRSRKCTARAVVSKCVAGAKAYDS